MASVDRERLRHQLRAAGLRATAPRVEVLRALAERRAPVSHSQLCEALAGWDRATLYRNLTDLAEVGLLRRIDHGDHVWRYEAAGHPADHAHFVCTSCGDVACVPEVTIALPAGAAGPRALAGGRVDVELRGECDACSPQPVAVSG
jgi:Fur family ferric uptake transcriptional regulator